MARPSSFSGQELRKIASAFNRMEEVSALALRFGAKAETLRYYIYENPATVALFQQGKARRAALRQENASIGNKVRALHRQGHNIEEIATRLGVAKSFVRYHATSAPALRRTG